MTTEAKCTCTTYGWCAVCRPVTPACFDPPPAVATPPRPRALEYSRLRITPDGHETAALILADWSGRNLSEATDMVDRVLAVFIVHSFATEEPIDDV